MSAPETYCYLLELGVVFDKKLLFGYCRRGESSFVLLVLEGGTQAAFFVLQQSLKNLC
jgi:hypothetical protein